MLPEPIALPDGYRLRPWTGDDVDTIAALDAVIFGPDAWSHELLVAEYEASQSTEPHTCYQVLTYHDVIVGFAGLFYGPPVADITTIGVHPDHTGKKLGVALLAWLIRTAQELGAEDVLLEVRADNTVAQRLYAHNGFTHIHTRPGYYPHGVDALIMRKRLRPPRQAPPVGQHSKETQ